MRLRRSALAAFAVAAALGWGAHASGGLTLHVDRVEEHGQAGEGPLLLVLDPHSRAAFAAWTRRHVGQNVQFSVDGQPVLRARVTGAISSGTIVLPAEAGRRSGAIELVLAHGKGMLTAVALQ